MTKNSAPTGATGSACLSDLVTIDRARLLDIIDLLNDGFVKDFSKAYAGVESLRDLIAIHDLRRNCISYGAAVRVAGSGYIEINALTLELLETAVTAVRAAIDASPSSLTTLNSTSATSGSAASTADRH